MKEIDQNHRKSSACPDVQERGQGQVPKCKRQEWSIPFLVMSLRTYWPDWLKIMSDND